ncbi:MAG: hypothetical protein PHV30_05685 [Candidatus Margulisbacteria bacterium]|nr:hypothetical protein [Candidatus Margulisiibacteriota bacterium]
MYDVFITTNGPGEIATWVTPVVKELKKQRKDIRITLFLLPCRFSTGTEMETATGIKEIDQVFRPEEFWKNLRRLSFKPTKKGVVLFLGGDLLWALLLKWRYGYKAIAYTEGAQNFRMFYDAFFTRDKDGDLMFSYFEHTAADEKFLKELKKTKNIVFFPGSRPEQFKHLFPLMQKAVQYIKPELKCIFNISSFIPEQMLQKYRLDKSIIYYKDKTFELMLAAYMAVSIPGTNNIQLAYLNVPTLIVFPFNYPEVVNFKGLMGAILNLPLFRTYGKKWLLKSLDKKVKYTSLLNTKENQLLFPEFRGELDEQKIAGEINRLAADHDFINSSVKKLKSLNKKSGALDKIIGKINEIIRD